MDEMANSASEVQGSTPSSPVSSPAPASSNYAPAAQTDDRLFTQSELNDIVRRAKNDAVEGYKRKASSSEYAPQDSYAAPQRQPNQPSPNQYYSPDEIRRMAAEETQRLRDEWVGEAQRKALEQDAQRIVGEFFNKLSPGKEKYQDFEKVVGDVDLGRFPNVVQLLHGYTDNVSDVMYELGKDRTKLAMLETLCNTSPRDAIVAAQRLSQSLKDNETAQKTRFPNEPLSQLRPSNTGTDNGVMSVSDYRRKYKI